jgi:hypothetical protein
VINMKEIFMVLMKIVNTFLSDNASFYCKQIC